MLQGVYVCHVPHVPTVQHCRDEWQQLLLKEIMCARDGSHNLNDFGNRFRLLAGAEVTEALSSTAFGLSPQNVPRSKRKVRAASVHFQGLQRVSWRQAMRCMLGPYDLEEPAFDGFPLVETAPGSELFTNQMACPSISVPNELQPGPKATWHGVLALQSLQSVS